MPTAFGRDCNQEGLTKGNTLAFFLAFFGRLRQLACPFSHSLSRWSFLLASFSCSAAFLLSIKKNNVCLLSVAFTRIFNKKKIMEDLTDSPLSQNRYDYSPLSSKVVTKTFHLVDSASSKTLARLLTPNGEMNALICRNSRRCNVYWLNSAMAKSDLDRVTTTGMVLYRFEVVSFKRLTSIIN